MMKFLRPTALVILVAASFSSSAQPPKNVKSPKNVISLDQYAGFAYGGEAVAHGGSVPSPGGGTGMSVRPGRIHAASLTVTADPGAVCFVEAGIRTDFGDDGIDIVDYKLLFINLKAGATAPNSQSISYAFEVPIEVDFNLALDLVLWYGKLASNSQGFCMYGGSVVYEEF